jgi:enoyl-CoA hydratase/carnithine racemase
VQAQSIEGLHNWIEAIRTFPKPVIAAVEGAAAGAGFSLALACDLIVAAATRCSSWPTARSRCRPTAAAAGAWRALPRQLATELLMCGERIGAKRLHELGMVNRLCDARPGAAPMRWPWPTPERARAQCAGQHQGTCSTTRPRTR